MKKTFTLLLAIAAVTINAQKMKVEQGNFDFISGQKEI